MSNLKVSNMPCLISRFGISNLKVSSFSCPILGHTVSNSKVSNLSCPISGFGVSNLWDSKSSMSNFIVWDVQFKIFKSIMPNFKVKGVQFEGIRFAISNCSFQSCNPKYLVSTPLIFKFCYAQKPFLLEVLQI